MQRHEALNKVHITLPTIKLVGALHQLKQSGARWRSSTDTERGIPSGFYVEIVNRIRIPIRVGFHRTRTLRVHDSQHPTHRWLTFMPEMTLTDESSISQPSERQVILCLTRQIGLREFTVNHYDELVPYNL